MIVASILLAFALDAWWDGQVERSRVTEMLDAVATEFEAEIVAMDSVVAENERAVEWYRWVLPRSAPDLPPLSEDSVRIVGSEIEDFQIWDPGFGALAALLNGALLEQVPDPELRRMLGGWDGEMEDLAWTRRQVFDRTELVVDLFVTTRRAPQLLDDAVYVARLRGIVEDPEMRAAETMVLDALNAYVVDLYRIRDRAGDIVARIRSNRQGDG